MSCDNHSSTGAKSMRREEEEANVEMIQSLHLLSLKDQGSIIPSPHHPPFGSNLRASRLGFFVDIPGVLQWLLMLANGFSLPKALWHL